VLGDTGRPIRSCNPADTTGRDAGMLVRTRVPPRLAPRGPGRGRRRPTEARPQLLGHDLDDRAGATVLSGPGPLLEPAHDHNPAALGQGLRGVLGLVAPHDHGEERRLLLPATGDGHPEHGPSDAALGVPQLGDAIPTRIRDNCQVAISFATRTVDGAVAALGEEIRQHLDASPVLLNDPAYVGVAVTSLPGRPGFHRVRTPQVDHHQVGAIIRASAGLRADPTELLAAAPSGLRAVPPMPTPGEVA